MVIPLIAAGIGAAGSIFAANRSARAQTNAADRSADATRYATDRQIEAARGAEDRARTDRNLGAGDASHALLMNRIQAENHLRDGYGRADELTGYFGRTARDELGRGYSEARDLVSDGYGRADELTGYFGRTARDELGRGYSESADMLAPYSSAGRNALAALQFETGMGDMPEGYGGFRASPGYNFRREEAERALERIASARGLRLSGATKREGMRVADGMASEEYGNHINLLAGLMNTGYDAAGRTASMRSNLSGNLANSFAGEGTTRAGLAQGRGQTLGGMRSNLAGNKANNLAGEGATRANLAQGLGSTLGGMYSDQGVNLANVYMRRATGNASGAMTTGDNMGSAYENAGNALASTATARGDAQAGGILGMNNALQGGLGNLTSYWMLDQMGAFGNGQNGGGMFGMGG